MAVLPLVAKNELLRSSTGLAEGSGRRSDYRKVIDSPRVSTRSAPPVFLSHADMYSPCGGVDRTQSPLSFLSRASGSIVSLRLAHESPPRCNKSTMVSQTPVCCFESLASQPTLFGGGISALTWINPRLKAEPIPCADPRQPHGNSPDGRRIQARATGRPACVLRGVRGQAEDRCDRLGPKHDCRSAAFPGLSNHG